jgi:hypothetical protein
MKSPQAGCAAEVDVDCDSHSLAHQRFGAIVLAFHKAIGEARGQEVKEGQNFLSPVAGPTRLCAVLPVHGLSEQ